MSVNMNEDESEVAEGFTRVLRTAMMGSMQVREGMERRKQQVEREAEKAAGERQAKERELFQRNEKVAGAVQRDVQSPMFWNHADNKRVADLVTVSQELAGKHPQADAAYMMASDVLRDKHGIKLETIMNGPGDGAERHDALLAALDHHNAAGRVREESAEQDRAVVREASIQEANSVSEEQGQPEQATQATALEAEREAATAWAEEHYPDQAVRDPHTLYAEAQLLGHDMDSPPEINASLTGLDVDWETKLAARDTLASAVGLDNSDLMANMDSRSVPSLERMYASEANGSIQQNWSFDGADKLGDVMTAHVDKYGSIPEVNLLREPGTVPQRGEYSELLKSVAENEARAVGMSSTDYLDHLEPTQHRLLLHSQDPSNSVYERGHELMGEYRQAYAQASFDAYQKAAGADHLKAQNLLEESEVSDLAATSSKQDVENSTQADETKYSEHLVSAAGAEAEEAQLPVETYLDSLTDEQRETLSSEADKGIEDSPERDERIDHAKTQAEASEVPERNYDTQAEVAKDDAALAQKSEGENLTRAAQALPESDHQQAMDKHLANVAKKDPQAANARGQALKNVPGSGKDYVKQSMDSKATPRKAAGQKQTAGREHVHQR